LCLGREERVLPPQTGQEKVRADRSLAGAGGQIKIILHQHKTNHVVISRLKVRQLLPPVKRFFGDAGAFFANTP
jgi:hypothetical protein